MSAELARMGISPKAPLSLASFDQLWARFAGVRASTGPAGPLVHSPGLQEDDSVGGGDAHRLVMLLAEAVKMEIDAKKLRVVRTARVYVCVCVVRVRWACASCVCECVRVCVCVWY